MQTHVLRRHSHEATLLHRFSVVSPVIVLFPERMEDVT